MPDPNLHDCTEGGKGQWVAAWRRGAPVGQRMPGGRPEGLAVAGSLPAPDHRVLGGRRAVYASRRALATRAVAGRRVESTESGDVWKVLSPDELAVPGWGTNLTPVDRQGRRVVRKLQG